MMDPGFRRRKRRDKIYDKLHRGVVHVCVSVTVLGTLFCGYKIYEYFRYIRPIHLTQVKLAEEALLEEGKSVQNSTNVELSS